VADRWEMRRLISTFVSPVTFTPEHTDDWEKAYRKYQSITSKK
jgi:rhamnulokinase